MYLSQIVPPNIFSFKTPYPFAPENQDPRPWLSSFFKARFSVTNSSKEISIFILYSCPAEIHKNYSQACVIDMDGYLSC